MQLKNKVAIITGAKQGIGFGIASAFAKEGYNVVVSDIAQAAVFLASDKSNYITGQVLVVDGGWTLR